MEAESDLSQHINAKQNEDDAEEGAAELQQSAKETVNEDDISCGMWGWRPKWLQILASKKSLVFLYGMLGMNNSIVGSYFGGTITTLEKRFKLPSSAIGLIGGSWDIGSTLGSLTMAYFGSSGNKAKWVAVTAIFSSLSCFIRYMPHLWYGTGIKATISYTDASIADKNLCNATVLEPENCSLNTEGLVAVITFTMANLIIGLATSSYTTLGAAYMDENVSKRNFPALFGISTMMQFVGPAFGFAIAAFTLNIFIEPSITPTFDQTDPRWMGAWYIGWIPLGIVIFLLSSIFGLFPKILPREAQRRVASGVPIIPKKRELSIRDFNTTMIRLFKNPILVLNTISSTFYIIGLSGYWTFMPKYVETQFRKSAVDANLLTGALGIICTSLGILSSGFAITRFKPSPTLLAGWNVFTEAIDVVGHFSFIFIGCLKDDLAGFPNNDGTWNITQECNANCGCESEIDYTPICSEEMWTYYSPCHAGCTHSGIINGTETFFNCSCIGGSGMATRGVCPIDCSRDFTYFITLMCIMMFLSATGRAGNTIIQFRAVDPEDKAISIGLSEVVLSVFGFVPAPILYGILIDSSCLVWGEICGNEGNCWLYHGYNMRYYINVSGSGFLLIALLFDIGVLYNVKDLKIYDDDDEINIFEMG